MADYTWAEDLDLTVKKKVGIGTKTPSQKLDVIGNIAATGDISATNLNLNDSLTINQNLAVSGNFQLGTLAVNEFSSDGNLADNSNLAVPTEQAVKTYVDNQIKTRAALNGSADEDFATNNLSVDDSLTVGNAIATNQLNVTGSITAPLTIDGNLTVNGAIATAQLSVSDQVTGSLTIENDLTVGNAIATKEVNATGKIQANRFEGDGSGLDGIVKKAGDTMTGALTVNGAIAASSLSVTANTNIGGNLKVDGNLEVMGDVTARDVEHVFGNVSFGDADDDEVRIIGVLRSGHSSGALRVDDALHTTGSLTVDGNVGIGTTTPEAKLDIEGDALLGYENYLSDFGAPLKSGFYQGKEQPGDIPDTSAPWTHLITARHSNKYNNHQLQIAASYTVNDRIFFRKIATGSLQPQNPTWNEIATRGKNTFKGDQHIDGKVGIGTKDPGSYKLNVQGNQYISGDLTVNGKIASWLTVGDPTQGNAINLEMHNQFHRIAFHQLRFWDWGVKEDMVTFHNGNVGIGTANPKAKLDVNGSMNVNGRLYRSGHHFSVGGSVKDQETVKVPCGNTDDWNIFVSPRVMGRTFTPGKKYGDDALFQIQCFATKKSNTSWCVTAKYVWKIKHTDENPTTEAGKANYILIPR